MGCPYLIDFARRPSTASVVRLPRVATTLGRRASSSLCKKLEQLSTSTWVGALLLPSDVLGLHRTTLVRYARLNRGITPPSLSEKPVSLSIFCRRRPLRSPLNGITLRSAPSLPGASPIRTTSGLGEPNPQTGSVLLLAKSEHRRHTRISDPSAFNSLAAPLLSKEKWRLTEGLALSRLTTSTALLDNSTARMGAKLA